MAIIPIKLNGKSIKPHKAIISPILNSKNVLTNAPWDFVDLWLRKEKQEEAVFFWNQAREFNKASTDLPTQSAPLLHYYSFMNATKALLSAKGVTYNKYHGVSPTQISSTSPKISISNEGVKIKPDGVLPALSAYLGESETLKTHSLQEIFFNLPYIHRTYCLTYSNQKDMFIPLRECEYVHDNRAKTAFFRAKLSKDFSSQHIVKRLPSTIILDSIIGQDYVVKSVASVPFTKASRPTNGDIQNLLSFHKGLRQDIQYINGVQTLWYAKSNVNGPRRLSRFPLTLTLAAMHCLSDLCRYRPIELSSFLTGQKNWLLSEFIQQAPLQFLDEIASEITGYQFLVPNIRPAA
ncbi:MAG TPA: YaaC family protein [Cyclobacteriaceae bacterium]|nr:YaaC family protein [Cyclobacteriaceae bacterium]HMV08073.1 YaaC family protein [Cyclobacteriaceae bacterium]HMV88289.1 YaaC family protein [Cyclobacteriaceae bacterium]HMX00714.1 YaaC family protein [Cyclobacteriaceae bacterium]HMX49411.1 YaaC family protein [Cyclobacteriaceae bacterium]